MLFKKLGLPQAMICRSIFQENRGRQKWRMATPRKKGMRATRAHTSMPQQEARAAAQMP